MKYKVYTESRKCYIIDENRCIIRTDMRYSANKKWTCIGFKEVGPFGRLGTTRPIEAVTDKEMCFKNGRGRYVLMDYDHGTYRLWGDRIVAIERIG